MKSDAYVILVTGPRDYKDYGEVARNIALEISDARDQGYKRIVVRCGDAKGVDEHAREFINKVEKSIPGVSISIDVHKANWNKHGKAAGPIRNQGMVDLGADVCLYFLGPCTREWCKIPKPHSSHGAQGCAKLARQAGIRVKEV